MSKMNSLLSARLKGSQDRSSKMATLAEKSSMGALSSFSGVFKLSALTEQESELLRTLLEEYKQEEGDIGSDFQQLCSITCEVKAINNQAVILHGERIKKAQNILKKYRDGAFTLWLLQTYGNRQTPYNFLQYFEFYEQLPQTLHGKLDEMPRQAIYTLASREGDLQQKVEIVQSYAGEGKEALLDKIRRAFPLAKADRRGKNLSLTVLKSLQRIADFLMQNPVTFQNKERQKAKELLRTLQSQIL